MYNISVQFTEEIDLSIINHYFNGNADEDVKVPREAIQAIELILKHGPTSNRIPIGNSLYPKWDPNRDGREIIDRNGIKQVAYGHYQSMRLTKVGPTLLVDRSATAFYIGGSLVDFVGKIQRVNDTTNAAKVAESIRNISDINRLTEQLKGLRIYTDHLPYKRPYIIKEVANKSAETMYFDIDENGVTRRINVKQYFLERYGRNIRYHFPCIITQGSRANYLPLELCHLFPDQPVPKGKLTPDNTSEMVKRCGSQKPIQRFQEIYRAVDNIREDSSPYLTEFDITIDNRPLAVKGRVLNQPNLDQFVYRSAALNNWTFVNLVPDEVKDNNVKSFVDSLINNAKKMRINIRQPKKIWNDYGNIAKLFAASIQECGNRAQLVQLIMFVIPDHSPTYESIKFNGDINNGIATQCIKYKNVLNESKYNSLQQNLLFKINAKLGGINFRLKDLPDKPAILNQRTMIIGADVTHPAPADKLSSSISACVASYDNDHCFYLASIKVQESKN
jgi:eukaryotic translation initiation factor 2C